METPKVLAALAQLDPSDDSHWNTDGLPNTGTVQKLANDQTIKRSDIQAARPGFDRAAAVEAKAPKAATPIEPIAPVEAKVSVTKPVLDDKAAKAAAIAGTEEVVVSDAQLRAHLTKRVKDAEQKREAGKAMQRDGIVMQNDAAHELTADQRDLHKWFPPMTAAENIKAHLRAEAEIRQARVQQGAAAASHLDQIRRPGGFSANKGYGPGRSKGTFSLKEAAKLGMVVPGSAAEAAQTAAREARAMTPGTKA